MSEVKYHCTTQNNPLLICHHTCTQLEDWHSEEWKLMPTLTFDLLTSNKMVDQDLSCPIHLPSLVMIRPVFFVLECWHTCPLTHIRTEPMNTLLPQLHRHARYLAEYLTHFHQTYINDALWDRDEHFTIWGQRVKGQGHGGIKYACNCTFWPC